MHLLGPLLLLVEYLAFSDSESWKLQHPSTLYTWEDSCVWIPCGYTIPGSGNTLGNLIVYQNPQFDNKTKNFSGTVLYNMKTQFQERVQFRGDNRSNCTLRIYPVTSQDNGRLGLRMTSRDDKWMEKIVLNVSKTAPPPHLQLPPEIRELQKVTLTCFLNVSCFERIRLRWSLEGSELGHLHPVSSTYLTTEAVSTQTQLTFQPQWTHHGKTLTCQLWNDTANGPLSQKMVQLDVKHSPKLEIKVSLGKDTVTEGYSVTMMSPEEVNVTQGRSVTMTCQIISSNPTYKKIRWLKNGITLRQEESLQKENKLTLTLSTVTKDMSGNYYCEANNEIGSGKAEMAMHVHYAPESSRVHIFPSPAQERSTVTLTCISQASPPPTNYTWYHNEIEVSRSTDMIFQISNVLLKHAGKYSCLAENHVGRGQIGQVTELDVQYPPKEVIMVIQNPTPIREGDNVTLSCNYTSSNPKVTRYEWSPQGSWKELVPGVMMIQKVAWNIKPFTCSACNLWCSMSLPVNLNVQYAPRDVKVLLLSSGSEIHSGHPVRLQCNISSSHPKDVRFFWEKNGILLKEGKELSFDSISPEDAGNYNCLANNSVGQSTSEAWMLRVLYAPRRLRVSIRPKDSVVEGEKVVLTCESDANPPVSQYAWFDWNNQNLHHHDQMLTLDPVKVQHSGTYWCQGANRLGVNQSSPSTLTVYYSLQTISKQVALGVGLCLAILFLAFLGVKLWRSWKRIQSQQGLQENSNGQSFFVRNKKVRRAPLSGGPASLGCYNPAMEDAINYATLRFPTSKPDTPSIGEAETPEAQRPSFDSDNTVTYSVVQKCQVGDYENVTPNVPEDEGIHYSELVHLGLRERPASQDRVEYVTLKH